MDPPSKDLTLLMNRAADGSPSAAADLLPLVYDELRGLAAGYLVNEPRGHTLQPTALVHEAYLRLGADPAAKWESRRHYFGAAAMAMRRILIERARRVAGPKHGGGRRHVPLQDADPAAPEPIDWLALDSALTALQQHDEALAELVLLRYFAGLSIDQAAAALGVSPRTVDRDWRVARAFLQHHILGDGADTSKESRRGP